MPKPSDFRLKSLHLPELFSHWFPEVKEGKFLVVVIVADPSPAERYWIVTAYRSAAAFRRNCDMETSLTVEYDKAGDILYLGEFKGSDPFVFGLDLPHRLRMISPLSAAIPV
jgi:hypothetical protein